MPLTGPSACTPLRACRGHHAGPKLTHNFFPHFRVLTNKRKIKVVEHKTSRLCPLVVTTDTVLVKNRTLGGDGRGERVWRLLPRTSCLPVTEEC